MATKFIRSILVAGEVESTPGTDPDGTKQAVQVDAGAIPVSQETSTPRNIVQSSFSKLSPSLSQQLWSLPCSVEIAGGGVGVVPAIDWMWQSAGLKRTAAYVVPANTFVGTFTVGEAVTNTTQAAEAVGTVAAVSTTEIIFYGGTNLPADLDALLGVSSGATCAVNGTPAEGYAYRPTSVRSEQVTASIRAYIGGADAIRKIMTYARATLSLTIGVGPKPSATFGFQGIYTAPSDTAATASNYLSIVPPDGHGGTSVFGAVDLSDIAKESLTIDLGNQITPRADTDQTDAIIGLELSDRTVTATWNPEVATLSDFNPYALKAAQTQTKLQYRWGSAAGNRHLVDLPGAVISAVTETDRNGIAAYNLSLNPEAVNSIDDSEFIYIVY